MGATFFSYSGRAISWPQLEIAVGLYPGVGGIHKFGFNAAVGTTEATIWDHGGLYAYPSSASVMTVSSDDVNDTSAGTGARTIHIYGLDEDYLEVDEIVSLNGTTGVSTTNSYLRVNRGIVESAGSGESGAGNIFVGTGTITSGEPANVFARITAGENQTLMAVYTIPAKSSNTNTGYLKTINMNTQGNASATANARIVARPFGQVFQTKDRFVVSQAGGNFHIEAEYPPSFAEKTDLEIRAASSVGTMDFSGIFELIEVNR